ncbi:MAG: cofactor-independent phosphoglycerate mutase [Deltaproteobacteria bacterium]|nr:cofactor-independent phosphoglycerate mutase [Deltaproteobacteria bacterium]
MKYLVLLGDGMADEPLAELGGKTPLEYAATPCMDRLARLGETGLVRTVPEGFPPGSDVANLSVFGYDPKEYYTGRSPLEAASMGVSLAPDDVAFRLNLVHLEIRDDQFFMGDFSAGHISTPEAAELIQTLQRDFGGGKFNFYPGVSYRHLMVWKGGRDDLRLTPPHDITHQEIAPHLPQGKGAQQLLLLMNSAMLLFSEHPINQKRLQAGKRPANAIWLWGQGRAPRLATFRDRFGISGAVISAVDLIKGIGVCAGLDVIEVPGATGYLDTNFTGKAEYALDALKSRDFIYLHVEAPDEASHEGSLEKKLKAIEDFDRLVVGRIMEGMEGFDEFRVAVLPDHPTPIRRMTHSEGPVPYILYGSSGEFTSPCPVAGYGERAAKGTGLYLEQGHLLLSRMVHGPQKNKEKTSCCKINVEVLHQQ